MIRSLLLAVLVLLPAALAAQPLPARLETAPPSAFSDIDSGPQAIVFARRGAASRGPQALAPHAKATNPPAPDLSVPDLAVPDLAAPDFAAPEDAATAMLAALLSGEAWKMNAVLGPGGAALLHGADRTVEQEEVRRFILAYADRHRIERTDTRPDARAVLVVGPRDWPFPVPLLASAGGWRFDVAAGAAEVLNRRIGRNELGAIRALAAIAAAQARFRERADGPHSYAWRLFSAPAQHDGLFWPAPPPSPLAGLISSVQGRGYALYPWEVPGSYRGYRLRLLLSGGGHSYVAAGHLASGFAYVAWPARYGETGVMTFLLGPDGRLRQRDLGPRTAALAKAIHSFDPDAGWSVVAPAAP